MLRRFLIAGVLFLLLEVLSISVTSHSAKAPEQAAAPLAAATEVPSLVVTPPPTTSPQPNPNATCHLLAVGDIMLARSVARSIDKHNDALYPYRPTMATIAKADLAFANLENPITAGDPVPSGSMIFHANPGVEKPLAEAGFDIVSLANNHMGDHGAAGVADTLQYLDAAKIKYVGAALNDTDAYTPTVVNCNGLRVAFLAFNDSDVVPARYEAAASHAGTAFMREDKLQSALASVASSTDVRVVSMHSGTEYADEANAHQTTFAKAAIDAGADLVIGQHPHVVQPVEQYKGKFILYSLGNFIFDQMWSQPTREGAIADITLQPHTATVTNITPTLISDYAQPKPLSGSEATAILQRMHWPPANP